MTTTEDATYFNDKFLSKIDVVVFFNTTGDILNSSEEIALEGFIKSGGGFLGIHAAADTEYDWPFYQELIAAHFASHPPTQKARLIVHQETNHPAIGHLGNEWSLRDEWYSFKEPLKSHATLLMEVDDSSLSGKIPLTQNLIRLRGRMKSSAGERCILELDILLNSFQIQFIWNTSREVLSGSVRVYRKKINPFKNQ